MKKKAVQDTLKRFKRDIANASHKAGEGHVASAYSILDILWVLYDRVMDITPSNIDSLDRDTFILSKGHGSLGLYTVLLEKKFIDQKTFDSYGKFESTLGGHPDRTKVVGVQASTGSLGHGMPMAVGVALGMKISNKNKKVYTIIGDGECNEGTIWESALLASNHKLNNLYCIIDHNHSGDRALDLGNLEEKFKSFDWNAFSINGHDHEEIHKVLTTKNTTGRPTAIIATTVKGNGIKFMEENPHEWHHKSPNAEELKSIMKELE